ncbi:receptor-like protein EIX2 isoform X1 [Apium graveolens]|uniref:receptor-like protein EIX2 isoform X1 n=1 Tax=Apium graveolens TaxID=4045 RepID=UPI003D7AAFDF
MQKLMNYLVLAYALFLLVSSSCVCGCIESEKQVLLHFNESRVIDPNYDSMSSWFGDDCCSWEGIQCNNDGHVITLDLLGFSLTGPIPENIGKLTFLNSLKLLQNHFQGPIPSTIRNLTSLFALDLRLNNLNGSLPESLCQLSKLERLDVSSNQLSGSIPKCIGGLSNLDYLDISSNSWEGLISEQHFFNLTSLTSLYISSKSNLVFNVDSEWIPPFQLVDLYLESMNVGPRFPLWLLTQRYIEGITLRNTSISDTIPADWFVSLLSRADTVELSDNDINLPRPSSIPATNKMSLLALSNNHLSGDFPAYICNLTSLSMLLLSNTNISGELPRCLGNLIKLEGLDVMNNNMSGAIPDFLGSLRYLSFLNLHNNKFEGELPPSIQNSTELVVFDVGNNKLRDTLPPWTGEQLPKLMFLVLRGNHFYGSIPKQFCNYSSLQVLNLAGNHITGNLPPCFNNLTAMTTTSAINNNHLSLYVGERLIENAKGLELEYTSTLNFLFSIDVSNNNISGEIPEELMCLRNLLNLNLARNNLFGRIPDKFGKMEQLEYLDLSRNKLFGSIPQSLSELKFLIHLNLSFNDLSGRIPTGNQLQVLDNPSSIYTGNNQLCGRPTLKLCAGDPEPHEGLDNKKAGSDSGSNSDDERVWIYAGIGPGLLVGFLGFCASLHFNRSWRQSYFHFDKIALVFALSRKKF